MARNKVIKEQKFTYQELSELYDETSSELDYYIQSERYVSSELTYLKDFIRFKKLDEEFAYFCKPKLAKVAKHFWRMLHLQNGESCNGMISPVID